MLARKQAIDTARHNTPNLTMERSRLQQARTLAQRRQDYAEVTMIDAKLAELTASIPQDSKQENSSDVLAKLNERNRRLNQEQVRKAERAELERKRRERQHRAGTATPNPADRLKAKVLGTVSSRSVPFRRADAKCIVEQLVDDRLPTCVPSIRSYFASLIPLVLTRPHLPSSFRPLPGLCLAGYVDPGRQQLLVTELVQPLRLPRLPLT